MFTGEVVGQIWATKKVKTLEGLSLLLIKPDSLDFAGPSSTKDLVVAADPVGAGIGEQVIVAYGHAARNALGKGEDIAIEAAVIGIVDDVESKKPL